MSWFASLFSKRKNIRETMLLEGMTDIHSHLLPGVDDGVRDEEEMLAVLAVMEQTGVRQLFLTPHIMADLPGNHPAFLQERLKQVEERIPESLKVRLAGEYMLDVSFMKHLDGEMLTFDGKHVLVETSYLSSPPGYIEMLYELVLNGYVPVLAHPERYLYLDKKEFADLKEKGCTFQLNLFSLCGMYGSKPKANALWLLDEGFYDFLGSDVHRRSAYERGLSQLEITEKNISVLQKLLANNNRLFTSGV